MATTRSSSAVCGRCLVDTDYLGGVTVLPRHDICTRCGGLATVGTQGDRPIEVGQVWWSTSRALAPIANVVWDVNGYYRALAVAPTAGRAELGRAYREHGGSSDPWLTYAVGVLLNPDSRRAYDALVPPNVWRDDPRIRAAAAYREWATIRDLMESEGVEYEELEAAVVAEEPQVAEVIAVEETSGQVRQWGAMLLRTHEVSPQFVRGWLMGLLGGFAQHDIEVSWATRVTLIVSGIDTAWRVLPYDDGLAVVIPDDLNPDEHTVSEVCKALHKTAQDSAGQTNER